MVYRGKLGDMFSTMMQFIAKMRTKEEAVSPVIAVVLMVAITVVLASTVYLLVSGLIIPVERESQRLGVVVEKTSDGSNWSLIVVTSPSGMNTDRTYFMMRGLNGTIVTPKTPLSQLQGFVDLEPINVLSPNDYILLSTNDYPVGIVYEFLSDTGVLIEGRLQ